MSTGRVLLSWETLFDSSKAWIVWMRSIHRPGPGSRLRECRQGGRDGPSRSRRWRATRPAPSGRTRSRSAMVTRAPPERTNSAERSTISPPITLTTTSTSPTSSSRSRCRSRESPGAARRASPTRIVASARSRGPRGSASCIPGARDFPAGQDARADDGANRTGVERVSHACGVDDSAGDGDRIVSAVRTWSCNSSVGVVARTWPLASTLCAMAASAPAAAVVFASSTDPHRCMQVVVGGLSRRRRRRRFCWSPW